MKTCRKKSNRQTQEDDIQVFLTNDTRLKLLGQIFSNESSIKILTLLLEKESTIMEISKETEISPNLIMHHLKKMLYSNVVIVTKESKNSRGHPLRFYQAKHSIVILSKETSKNKSLKKILKEITKISVISIAGIVTWFTTASSNTILDSALKYPRPTLPPYMIPVEPQSGDFFVAVILTASVVILGLIINHMFKQIKNQDTC